MGGIWAILGGSDFDQQFQLTPSADQANQIRLTQGVKGLVTGGADIGRMGRPNGEQWVHKIHRKALVTRVIHRAW